MKYIFPLLLFCFITGRSQSLAAIPVANFTASHTSICAGQCINFTDLSSNNPTSWSWSFQGASLMSSTQQNPSNICYNTAGTYFVSLTVSNASGSNTLYLAGYITVYPSSVVNLLVNGNFNAYNTGFTSPLTFVPVGVMAPDQYSIDTNAYLHNPNWAGISPDTTPFFMCDGSLTPGQLIWSQTTSNVFPGSAYTFSFLMTNLDVNHTFVQPELMTTVTDQGGTVLFSGTTGLLPAANSNVPPVYVWTQFSYVFNTLSNTTSITISVSQVGGTYLGFDFGLEDMDLKTHFCDSLAALPSAGMITDESLLCPGGCADFINLSTNAISYQWFFPGGTPSVSTDANPSTVCYNTPGSYDVTLIATNASGSDTVTIPGYVNILPYPPPQGITQSGDTLFAIPGAVNYQWYHDGLLIAGATDYFYVATGSGNFNVVATDVNGCQVEAAIFDVVAGIANQPGPKGSGENKLNIFPDPAGEYMKIGFPSCPVATIGQIPEIRIYDALGSTVSCSPRYLKTDAGTGILECKHLSAGVYWLEVYCCDKIFRKKFVKK